MDFAKLQEDVALLEKSVEGVKKGDAASLKVFAVRLKEILVAFLKDRREPIRPGQLFKDAAARIPRRSRMTPRDWLQSLKK
jgi:hypothetical protein